LVNTLYEEILRMILKRIKNFNVSGSDGYSGNNYYTPPTTIIDDPGNDDPTPTPNPSTDIYSIIGMENYNYQLKYDSEEELIGFTSNNGDWFWKFNKDDYGDLISVKVENPYLPFIIALIWTNYDQRRKDPETDEKGLLSEVVLLNIDGTSLFSDLILDPTFISVAPNETATFKAYLRMQDGSKVDCSSSVDWEIDNNYSDMVINNGVVSNLKTGTWKIRASYKTSQVTAQLEVRSISLKISPQNSILNPDDFIQYIVSDINNTAIDKTVDTKKCTWSIVCKDPTVTVPSITDGFVGKFAPVSTTYTVFCEYLGNTIQAQITVTLPELLIDPATVSIYDGQTCQFNAYLKRAGEFKIVTNDCVWLVGSADLTVNKGRVANTLNHPGNYDVMASYAKYNITGSSELTVKNASLVIEPNDVYINQNDVYQFDVYYIDNEQGTKTLVNADATWTAESPCVIDNGKIINSTLNGTFGITAEYNGIKVNAILHVVSPHLEIDDSSYTLTVGDTHQFKAYFVSKAGKTDVTGICIWHISPSTATIRSGNVYNCNTTGTYDVGATYVLPDGTVYNADSTLTVTPLNVIINVDKPIIYLGDTVNVVAKAGDRDITSLCTWYENGILQSNFTGVYTPKTSGSYTLTAKYTTVTGIKSFQVQPRILQINPPIGIIGTNNPISFKALLHNDTISDVDVTGQCMWSVTGGLTISTSGTILNTPKTLDSIVTAKHSKIPTLSNTSRLLVYEHIYDNSDKNVSIQIRNARSGTDDYITVWLNDSKVLDNIQLTDIWSTIGGTLQTGINVLKIGVNSNAKNEPEDKSVSKVSALLRGVDLNNNIILNEELSVIDSPIVGSERITVDPTQYYTVWIIRIS
jgi:hypothetical protein